MAEQTNPPDWRADPLERTPIVRGYEPGVRMEQPGETQTYSARVKGANIMRELDGLTPWAALQVLEWATQKTRGRAATTPTPPPSPKPPPVPDPQRA